MTFINYASREITARSSTTVRSVRQDHQPAVHLRQDQSQAKGKLISLATETDRTLFFDFLPLELGNVRGFRTRFHLYTVPGRCSTTPRAAHPQGRGRVIFVADSQEARMDANVESLNNLQENLRPRATTSPPSLRPAAQQA